MINWVGNICPNVLISFSTQLLDKELRPDTDPIPDVADPEALEILDTQLAALLS